MRDRVGIRSSDRLNGGSSTGAAAGEWIFASSWCALLMFLISMLLKPGFAYSQVPVPPAAAAAGYTTSTFASDFTRSNVDMSNSRKPGFNWYLWQFFGNRPTRTDSIRLNQDGTITLLGDSNSKNGSLATVAQVKTPQKFVGKAFGGGAYFEAVLKFDPSTVVRSKGWPSFWSNALEQMVSLESLQWPGQGQGYEHFIEPDFFEYDFGNTNSYGGAIHDWYGIYNKTCHGYCQAYTPNYKRTVPKNVDFSRYHGYGFLWVPATDSSSGFAEYYFDNHKIGLRTSWGKFSDQPPAPSATTQSWTFGIMDRQHLVLVLGTGVGEPMTVERVDVWQASAAKNLIATKPREAFRYASR
jgi:hypothetical protein